MSASDTSIAPSTAGPASAGRLGRATWTEALLLAALTALGLALRLPGLSQSLFGDELSTYWVVTHHTGFGGVWTSFAPTPRSPRRSTSWQRS
ncbi:MAG: hypothetical protein U0R52_12675 [Solirubrobacterales bacterium]